MFLTSRYNLPNVLHKGGVAQGGHIIQWGAHGGKNQLWTINADSTITLKDYPSMALDIEGENKEPKARVDYLLSEHDR